MDLVNTSLIFIIFFHLLLSVTNAETPEARDALVQFMERLSPGGSTREANWGWNTTSDPCNDGWKGVTCKKNFIHRIDLANLTLAGELDTASLCATKALAVLNLSSNHVVGVFSEEISKCRSLTHIDLHGNIFSGNLPTSLSRLGNLKRLDLSDNGFSGNIPDLSRVSGLLSFLAQDNQLSGGVPPFDFSNLEFFNVSNNNLSGSIPDVGGKFDGNSFFGNLGLCGKPLSEPCPPSPPPKKKFSIEKEHFVYGGYALIGVLVACLVAYKLIKKWKMKAMKNDAKIDTANEKASSVVSEFSIASVESGKGSTSLVILSSHQLRFEDLLRAPAELVGKGRHGTLYKVFINEAMTLAVKRIRDWDISMADFKTRMQRIDLVKHPNVMPALAFYCSSQEKLLVFEFHKNGSLFGLLHGIQGGEKLDWARRLSIAAKTSEALAFMHEGLQDDGVAHGNIKTSNILLNNEMQPCLSEYGLQEVSFVDQSESNSVAQDKAFEADTYGFGVVLLELLTGDSSYGCDLAELMSSTTRQQLMTAEVLDRSLVAQGANKEQMLRLLHLAFKCMDSSSEARPTMREVSDKIKSILTTREFC